MWRRGRAYEVATHLCAPRSAAPIRFDSLSCACENGRQRAGSVCFFSPRAIDSAKRGSANASDLLRSRRTTFTPSSGRRVVAASGVTV